MIFINVAIVFFSSIIGIISGVGGAPLFKPILLIFNDKTFETNINFFTTITTIVTAGFGIIIPVVSNKLNIENKRQLIDIVLGAILGGALGKHILIVMRVYHGKQTMFIIQTILLMIILISLVRYSIHQENIDKYHITSMPLIFLLSAELAMLSAFLETAGGFLNIIMIFWFLNVPMRESSFYSSIIILFSQITNVILFPLAIEPTLETLRYLPYMLIPGAIGGILGGILVVYFSETTVRKFYVRTLFIVMLLSVALFVYTLYFI